MILREKMVTAEHYAVFIIYNVIVFKHIFFK